MLTFLRDDWDYSVGSKPPLTISGASAGDLLLCMKEDDESGTGDECAITGGAQRTLLATLGDSQAPDPNSRVDAYLLGSGGELEIDPMGSYDGAGATLFSTDYPLDTATLTRLLERETPSQHVPSYTPYVNLVGDDIILVLSTVKQHCGSSHDTTDLYKTAGTAVTTRLAHHGVDVWGAGDGFQVSSSLYVVTAGGTFSFCGFSVHIYRLRTTVKKQYTIADSNWTLG